MHVDARRRPAARTTRSTSGTPSASPPTAGRPFPPEGRGGDVETVAADEHPRSDHLAPVDQVAHGDVHVLIGAEIADRGDARLERAQGPLPGQEHGHRRDHVLHLLQHRDARCLFRVVRHVGVGVDESRQARVRVTGRSPRPPAGSPPRPSSPPSHGPLERGRSRSSRPFRGRPTACRSGRLSATWRGLRRTGEAERREGPGRAQE